MRNAFLIIKNFIKFQHCGCFTACEDIHEMTLLEHLNDKKILFLSYDTESN